MFHYFYLFKSKKKVITKIVDYKEKLIKTFIYYADENTTTEEYFRFILKKYWGSDYNEDNNTLSFIFTFINNDIKRHARADYLFLEFINNFNYNIKDLHVYVEDGYGRGAGATIDNLISIHVNANENKHNNDPHVHITRPYKREKEYRINLRTLTQMYGDEGDWKDEFNLKERNMIIECIKKNLDTLIDMYMRITKGEYIEHGYIIEWDGKKYNIH